MIIGQAVYLELACLRIIDFLLIGYLLPVHGLFDPRPLTGHYNNALPSSSSYPRPDREREGGHALERQSSCTIRMVAMTTTKRKIAGLSPVHRIDTFDRVRIGDRVSTRDGSANESQWGRRERMIAPHWWNNAISGFVTVRNALFDIYSIGYSFVE